MNAQIVLEDVEVHFPERVLFEKVNFTLYEGMRIALAGRNGSGKSTLLRILAGQAHESFEGQRNIVGGRKLRIGFLDQTLLEKAVSNARKEGMASKNAVEHVKTLLTFDLHDMEDAELQWQIEKFLTGLGFSKELMEAPIDHLSGGWLLRTFIAGALLNKPEVLLLDEPTNHLDISSIQWLEEFLRDEYEGSLVIVTHDVELQKRTTDSLAVVHGGRFYFQSHNADYLSFCASLATEEEILKKQIEGLQKKTDQLEEFADKYKAKARMATRAQSKLKQVDKLDDEKARLEDRLMRIRGFDYNLRLNFQMDKEGSKFPIALEGIDFKYSPEGAYILKNVSTDIKRGQKVAIIGDNGAGKTTLLNVLAGRLRPQAGEVKLGYNLEMGYFGQHQLEELNLNESVLDNLRARAKGASMDQLRNWLGAFGFCGNFEVAKPAKVLSGGEKARLALLRILVTPINLCLLDEPTNHLDVETKELLKNAFKSYNGTLIFVSHDREFVEAVAERVIYLSLDHKLTDHIGDLNSFFEKYPDKVRHLDGVQSLKAPTMTPNKAAPVVKSNDSKLSYEERKKRKNRLRSLEKKVSESEQALEKLGSEKDQLQSQMEQSSDAAKQKQFFEMISILDKQITEKMAEWEKFSSELEQLRSENLD